MDVLKTIFQMLEGYYKPLLMSFALTNVLDAF